MSKKKCPEFENHERWLVSYADMLTLLFAVFVVLYSLNLTPSKPSANDAAAGSLQESFSTPLDEIPVEKRTGPSETGYGIFENFKGNQVRPPIVKKFPGANPKAAIIQEEMSKVAKELEERLYGPSKFQGSKKAGEARIVNVMRTDKGFKLQLLARHFYDPGTYQVKRSALGELDKVTTTLKDLGRDITIEGHTDSMPAKGELSNWELSSLRASYILRYMISKHNFPASKLSAAGYADLRPIAHNGTEQGRSLNRRIEIQVNYDPDYGSETE